MPCAVNDESDWTAVTVKVIALSRVPRVGVRTLLYAGIVVATALALAACGPSSGSGNAGTPAGGSTPAPTGTAGGGAGGQRQPGVNGLIAAVTGSTMQVQTRTDQTAVTWNDSTTFTTSKSATLADVTVGACVTVLEPAASGSATSGAGSAPATSVTAASVDVRPAVNGQCAGFGGAGGPGGGVGAGATPPTRAPSDTATTGPGGGRGGADGVRRVVGGQVTAVSADTFTVQETMRPRGTDTATATATPTTATVTVTTNASTTYTAQRAATAADVAVGECASAQGKADDTGAVTATAISLRPATNGSCAAGFGGRGGGRGGATGTATTGGSGG
jgi:Domain of unknown function (DUF5666)